MSRQRVGRRQFVKSAVGAGVTVGAMGPTVFAQEPVRGANDRTNVAPNIIVITCDDLASSVAGRAQQHGFLPNLTALAADGVLFANSFVNAPICNASRATFLTGQNVQAHGAWLNAPGGDLPGGVTALPDDNLLPVWLRAAGYRTGISGRGLNFYGADLVQDDPRDDSTYIPPGWDFWRVGIQTGPGGASASMVDYDLNEDGTIVHYTEYATDVLFRHALAFLDSAGEAPFFLWLTPTAPHVIGPNVCSTNAGQTPGVQLPERHAGLADSVTVPSWPSFNESDVSDKPAWLRNNYPLMTSAQAECAQRVFREQVASLAAVDDGVGALVARLVAAGRMGDTTIIVTSDNGHLHGQHRVVDKQSVYEQSIRVPLLIRPAGGVAAATSQRQVLNADLAPTIIELAGAVAGREPDGRSLVPLFTDPATTAWRRRCLIQYRQSATAGWSGVRADALALDTPNEVYLEYSSGEVEQYGLAADPDQLVNRAGSGASPWPEHRVILADQLSRMLEVSGAALRAIEDE